MRRFRFWPQMALVLAMAVMNGGCLLIPDFQDKLVELAVSGSTSAVFTVDGSATTADETKAVDVATELDLKQILEDAGIDVSDVTHVALSGVAYRIVRPDADPSREITNGTITVQRGGGAVENLVTGFAAGPGAASGFQNVSLDPAGVTVVNGLMEAIRLALPNPPADGLITFHLTGDMTSGSGNPADFDVELKITVSVTGTISVTVPS
jgi:hypothetical protein